jgi:bacteriochlorophyll C8 methyltransferase
MKHFLGFYKWRTIIKRVLLNPNKLINLVTSLIFKRNLKDQLNSVLSGKKAPLQYLQKQMQQNAQVMAKAHAS